MLSRRLLPGQVRTWLVQNCIQALRCGGQRRAAHRKHYCGEKIEITSCGSDAHWWDAKLICQRVLGYGALFRFVPKRRLSTINSQSEEIEEQLFEEVPGSEAVDPDHPPSYEEGLRKGMLRTVRRIIEHRFGPLTPDHEHRLWRLSRSDIEDLAVRLLEAKTLDEVFL